MAAAARGDSGGGRSGGNATERTPLLGAKAGRHVAAAAAAANVNGGVAASSPSPAAEDEEDEAEETRKVHAAGEDIKASLPTSMLVPALVSLWACLFISAIDGTLMIALLASISSSFGASQSISWLSTSYMLAMCAFAPVYGRASDIIGRKACMLSAVSVFAVGTAMCMLAPSMNVLILARTVQGIGAGGIQPCVGFILNDLAPLRKRGLYQSGCQICFSIGNALGGPVGGLLNDSFGWRFAFLIQIPPIVLAVFLLTVSLQLPELPKTPKERRIEAESAGKPLLTVIRQRLDIPGAILLVSAVVTLLLALSLVTANDKSWRDPLVYSQLVVSAVLTLAFVYVEAYVSRVPLVPIRLMYSRTLGAAWLLFFFYCVTIGVMFYFPLFFQTILEQSAADTGIHFLSISLATTMGSVLAGMYIKRSGRYYWLNIGCATLSLVTPAWLASWSNSNRPSPFAQNVVMAPFGLGTAATFTILMTSSLAVVERQEQATVVSLSYLFRSLGTIVGISTSGYLIQTVLTSELTKRITGPGAKEIIESIRKQINIVPSLPPAERHAAKESYSKALRVFHICAGVLMVVCLFLTTLIQERDLKTGGAGGGTTTSAQSDEEQGGASADEEQASAPTGTAGESRTTPSTA